MPGLLTPRRMTTLVASLFAALGAGTNHAYSGWAPQLGKRLAINHTAGIIGLAGNIGVYSTAFVWGRFADTHGPRVLLIIARGPARRLHRHPVPYSKLASHLRPTMGSTAHPLSMVLPVLTRLIDPSPSLADSHFVLLALCAFITGGVGGNGGLAAALNAAAKSCSGYARVSATGLVISGFGLCAFFFGTIAYALFSGDTRAFLLTLAIAPPSSGAVPHGEESLKGFDSGVTNDEDDEGARSGDSCES